MPKIRASFCIFGVPLCLLDHAFGPRVGSARPARSQDAAALAAITKADSVGWRLYGKTPRKIGFAPSVKSACSERSSEIVRVYKDHGISGAKSRDGRPEFDRLLRDAAQ